MRRISRSKAERLHNMVVLGIDPGTANTALVVVQGGAIRATTMITTKPNAKRHLRDFADLVARSRSVRTDVAAAVAARHIDIAVMESYQDYGGQYKRGVARRYYTPYTMAYIAQALEAARIPVVYQGAQEVKAKYKAARGAWDSKRFGIVPGDRHLSNEHLRDAATHALYYLDYGWMVGNGRV